MTLPDIQKQLYDSDESLYKVIDRYGKGNNEPYITGATAAWMVRNNLQLHPVSLSPTTPVILIIFSKVFGSLDVLYVCDVIIKINVRYVIIHTVKLATCGGHLWWPVL